MSRYLITAAAALALTATAAQAQTAAAQLDELDCTVRVMKVLSGTLNELKKTDLPAADRDQSEKLRSRSERALAYFVGRMDMAPKKASLGTDIAARWVAAGKLSIADQTSQTMQCLSQSDDAQMAFLKTASGS